jgi:hypothetical protein
MSLFSSKAAAGLFLAAGLTATGSPAKNGEIRHARTQARLLWRLEPPLGVIGRLHMLLAVNQSLLVDSAHRSPSGYVGSDSIDLVVTRGREPAAPPNFSECMQREERRPKFVVRSLPPRLCTRDGVNLVSISRSMKTVATESVPT